MNGQLSITNNTDEQCYGHFVNCNNNSNTQNYAEISPYVNNIDNTRISLKTNENKNSLYDSLINNK